MLQRAVLECYERISIYRMDLYTLARHKGISHTDVINLSQQLDKEIIIMQKILQEFNSFGNIPKESY
ncbi:aspartyl-phosphate phosphatase Spo0E family protein [Bacillus xiapuensis]|uniref:Aspartyl-phosphate phosphatase Spo0E family protein n=1 Tax=Bacillus xiapuensis TaxID=2014075 RepID=A0ABU6NE61_9BACI|nr:aspartyl-phosphate phosphatase Spo0E family protein [Bacillus xiapuensis]